MKAEQEKAEQLKTEQLKAAAVASLTVANKESLNVVQSDGPNVAVGDGTVASNPAVEQKPDSDA